MGQNEKKSKFDLEERLVKFSGDVILFTKSINKDAAGKTLINQIVRSSISSSLNYGEAQAAESTRDFKHKNQIVLKELKESRVNLKILEYINYGEVKQRNVLKDECEQLIAIFATIVKNTKV